MRAIANAASSELVSRRPGIVDEARPSARAPRRPAASSILRPAMTIVLDLHDSGCLWVIRSLLYLSVLVDDHRRRLQRRAKHWQRRLRRFYQRWLVRHGWLPPPPFRRSYHAWNKTPDHIEEQVVRLHVEQPHLGAGQLRRIAERVLGFSAARETFRQILIRRRDLVASLEDERRKSRRRIVIQKPRKLWGVDVTLVWVLLIVPVWLVGVVDYHGSRLVCFECIVGWPNAAEVARVIERTVAEHGAPERVLTDRAPLFRAPAVQGVLERHAIKHSLIRPCHAWTNGRIERIFKTFKETVFDHVGLWLFKSTAQVERFCSDFLVFYNRDRPHSSFDGRTPDEVYFDRQKTLRVLERVDYFEGRLHWYRFG
jgi:putative transposase